jgi:hypothetical protein
MIVFSGTLLASAAACGFVAWRFGRAPRRPFDGVDEVDIDAIEDLARIERAFDEAGVIFLSEGQLVSGGVGVRLKLPGSRNPS